MHRQLLVILYNYPYIIPLSMCVYMYMTAVVIVVY